MLNKILSISTFFITITIITYYNLFAKEIDNFKRTNTAIFSEQKLKELDDFILEDINQGFPGSVLLVIKDGKIIKNSAYGFAKKYDNKGNLLSKPQIITTDTMFDIASNTKIYATVYALQHLQYQQKIDINDPIKKYLPKFQDNKNDKIKGKNTITIADVLYHRAGFPADPQYHNKEQAGKLYSQNKQTTELSIYNTPLEYTPKTKHLYSDVDFLLLGILIEHVTKMPLDQYVETNIYKPLGLKHTMFNPLQKGFTKKDIAATELAGNSRDNHIWFENIRTDVIQGEVQDEKAFYAMQGVAGHAGLFSTSNDLSILIELMLNYGTYNGVTLFDKATINKFLQSSSINPTYALGWRKNIDHNLKWMFGQYAPSSTIGHSGWTGSLTLIDYENNLGIVFLNNKKHTKVLTPPVKQNILTTGCDMKSKKCYNKFQGDTYKISNYGTVISKVYEALQDKSFSN